MAAKKDIVIEQTVIEEHGGTRAPAMELLSILGWTVSAAIVSGFGRVGLLRGKVE